MAVAYTWRIVSQRRLKQSATTNNMSTSILSLVCCFLFRTLYACTFPIRYCVQKYVRSLDGERRDDVVIQTAASLQAAHPGLFATAYDSFHASILAIYPAAMACLEHHDVRYVLAFAFAHTLASGVTPTTQPATIAQLASLTFYVGSFVFSFDLTQFTRFLLWSLNSANWTAAETYLFFLGQKDDPKWVVDEARAYRALITQVTQESHTFQHSRDALMTPGELKRSLSGDTSLTADARRSFHAKWWAATRVLRSQRAFVVLPKRQAAKWINIAQGGDAFAAYTLTYMQHEFEQNIERVHMYFNMEDNLVNIFAQDYLVGFRRYNKASKSRISKPNAEISLTQRYGVLPVDDLPDECVVPIHEPPKQKRKYTAPPVKAVPTEYVHLSKSERRPIIYVRAPQRNIYYRSRNYAYAVTFDGVPCIFKRGDGVVRVEPQSQTEDFKAEARLIREIAMRARARKELDTKTLPKDKCERRRIILQRRDKRNPAFYDITGDTKPQIGIVEAATIATIAAAGGAVAAKLYRTIDIHDRAAQKAESLIDRIREILEQTYSGLSEIAKKLWYVPVLVMLYHFACSYPKLGIPVMAVSILTPYVCPRVLGFVSEFFQEFNSVKPQIGTTDLARLVSGAFAYGAYVNPRSRISELTKVFANIERCSGGIEASIKWALEALERMVNYAARAMGVQEISLINSHREPTLKWMRRVEQLQTLMNTNDVQVDLDVKMELLELVRIGNEYRDLYRGSDFSTRVNKTLEIASNLIQPHLGSLGVANAQRIEPVAVIITGNPGIGKTHMLRPFCNQVLINAGIATADTTVEQMAAMVFQKGSTEYWNGYSGQPVYVMDEAFKDRTMTGSLDNDYSTIISAVNTWPWPLNMADLGSKGKFFFRSRFIYGTTNIRCIRNEVGNVLVCPEAVGRRIQGYHMVVKPEYSKDGKIDVVKASAELKKCREIATKTRDPMDAYPWYMWTLSPHDFVEGRTDERQLEVRDVIEKVAAEMRLKTTAQIESIDQVQFTLDLLKPTPQSGISDVFSSLAMPTIFSTTSPEKLWEKWARETIERNGTTKWFDAIRRVAVPIAIFTGLGVAVYGLACAIKYLIRTVTSALRTPKKESDSQRNAQHRRDRRVRIEAIERKRKGVQAQSDLYGATNSVYHNTCKVYAVPTDSPVRIPLGSIMCIESDLAAMPHHYVVALRKKLDSGEWTDDAMLGFVQTKVSYSPEGALQPVNHVRMTIRKFLELPMHHMPKYDVTFVKLHIRPIRSMTQSFFNEADLLRITGVPITIDVADIPLRVGEAAYAIRRTVQAPSFRHTRKKLSYLDMMVERSVAYDVFTRSGDCGAPVMVADTSRYSGKGIIGMHIAGESEVRPIGYAAILTREMVEQAKSALSVVTDAFDKDIRNVLQQVGIAHTDLPISEMDRGSFSTLCALNRSHNQPRTSAYYETVIGAQQMLGECVLKPAHLASFTDPNGVLRNPMTNALAPYHTPLISIENLQQVEEAMHIATLKLFDLSRDHTRRIFTFDEAVVGVPELKFRSIPRGTSAGFPHVFEAMDGKKAFFGRDADYDLTGEKCDEMRERVACIIEAAKNNTRLAHVFVDFLKDELRKPEKVDLGKTRLISASPLAYVIAWRQYFGAFSAAFMTHNIDSGFAPGVCTYNEWHKVYDHLTKKGEACFDGDFSAFDSSLQPEVCLLVLDMVNRWYKDSEENQRVRRVLFEDLVHSRHLGGMKSAHNIIYQWCKSLPSGHPFTTIINSIYSLVALVVAYMCATGRRDFWNNVSAITYGDDNVCNVSDAVKEAFNQRTVAEHVSSRLNMTYTSASKDGQWHDNQTIADVSFLKRRFAREGMVTLCPLEFDSFYFTAYWCKNKRLQATIMVDVMETAIMELSLHSQEVWDQHIAPLQYVMDEVLRVTTRLPLNRKAYQRFALSLTDNWY